MKTVVEKMEDGVFYRLIEEDVEPLLDRVARERNDNPTGFSPSGNWRKIGEIPLIVIDRWFHEGFNAFDGNNAAELKRRLNEFSKFRTTDKPV
jgi:hypothetical protein